MHRSRSHDAVIRVYGAVGNVTATHEHKGDFKEFFFIAGDIRSLVTLRRLSR
jgi:hypothetical protein